MTYYIIVQYDMLLEYTIMQYDKIVYHITTKRWPSDRASRPTGALSSCEVWPPQNLLVP